MAGDLITRTALFRWEFARHQAAWVITFPGGMTVLDDRYPASQDHNQIILSRAVEPEQILVRSEHLLGHLPFRRISVLQPHLPHDWISTMDKAGYRHDRELIMCYQGLPVDPHPSVTVLPPEILVPAVASQVRRWQPAAADWVIQQLAQRRATRLDAAEEVTFLGILDEGVPVAWVDLYVQTTRSIAQIEELVTVEDHRGKGHGTALLQTARAWASRCRVVFLVTDPRDWPQQWYTRQGFNPIGSTHLFTKNIEADSVDTPRPS